MARQENWALADRAAIWASEMRTFPTREQRVFNIACQRNAVHEEFFALKGSQQLIGQCDPESVPAAMGVTALPIDGWLVVQVGRPCHDIGSRRLATRRMIRVDIDADRASIALLASPAVNIVLVTLERHSIDDARQRTRVRILARCRVPVQHRKRHPGGNAASKLAHLNFDTILSID